MVNSNGITIDAIPGILNRFGAPGPLGLMIQAAARKDEPKFATFVDRRGGKVRVIVRRRDTLVRETTLELRRPGAVDHYYVSRVGGRGQRLLLLQT